MTMIIGWLHGERPFLVSDTAQTQRWEPRWGTSSFGEAPHETSDGRFVEEGAAKIFGLGSAGVAAVCGASNSGIEFVRELRVYIARPDLVDTIIDLGQRLETKVQVPFEVLIARGGEMVLFRSYEPSRPQRIDPDQVIVLGSAPDILKEVANWSVRRGARFKSPEDQLVLTVSTLQLLGAQNYLPQFGIGGAFYGCFVDSAVQWLRDTLFLIVPPLAAPESTSRPPHLKEVGIEHVLVAVRDGWVCRTSSAVDATKEAAIWVLVPELAPDEFSNVVEGAWRAAWSLEVQTVMSEKRVRYLVLLSNAYAHMTVIDVFHSEPGKFMALRGGQTAFNPDLINGFQSWRPSASEGARLYFISDRGFRNDETEPEGA